MENTQTNSESFVQKMRNILDADLVVNDPVQFQIMLNAISIATAVAKIAAPTAFYDEPDGTGQLYWQAKDSSLNRVSVYIKEHSICDLTAHFGFDHKPFNFENIPLAAVVPLLTQALAMLHALQQEATG